MVVGDKCIGRCTLAVSFKYNSRTVCVDIFNTTGVVRRIYYSSHEAMWHVVSVDISTLSRVRFSRECLKRLDV